MRTTARVKREFLSYDSASAFRIRFGCELWSKLARRMGRAGEPRTRGQPVFREVIKGGHIDAGRLSDRSVSRIIKRRVRERAMELGRS